MARVTIPIQQLSETSGNLTMTAADATNHHEFRNKGREILVIRNLDASPKTVTIVSIPDRLNRTGDLSVVVPANSVAYVPPLPREGFNQPDGNVHVNVSAATGLSLAAIRVLDLREVVTPPAGGGGIPESTVLILDLGGQSNMVVSGASPALSTSQPFDNKRVDAGSITDLVETTVESPASGLANWLTAQQAGRVSYVSNEAVGGQTYLQLAQGTASYNASLDNIEDAANAVAPSEIALATVWNHGEADDADGVSAVQYRDNMIELQSDKQTDIRTRLGMPSLEVPLFITQIANWPQYGSPHPRSTVALGQKEAAEINALIALSCSTYPLTWQSSGNNIHLDNVGARRLGEYHAKAIYRWLIQGGSKWEPLHIESAIANSNVITLTVAGGDGSNLFVDTTNMLERHARGFEYWDQTSSPAAIVDVSVSGRTITITLNKEAHATGVIRYGLTAAWKSILGPNGNGPGGNIRDQDAAPSRQDAVPLYNWLIIDEFPLGSYTAGGASPPAWSNTQSLRLTGTQWASVADFNELDGVQRCTWSFWVRRDTSWPVSESSMWAKSASGARQFDFRGTASGAGKFYIAVNPSTNMNYTSANGVFSGNTWYHICVVFDGTQVGNARLRIYVNGVDITGSGTFSTTPPAAISDPTGEPEMAFGATSNGSTNFGSSNLKDCALWIGTALSSGQVSTLYNSGAPQDLAGVAWGAPTHWWRFNGDFADYGTASPRHAVGWRGVTFNSTVP